MTTLSFSQNTYPERILYNGDTVLAFSYNQTKILARAINELEFYQELVPALRKEISVLDNFQVTSLKEIDAQKGIISYKDSLILNSSSYIQTLESTLRLRKKQELKRILGVGASTLFGGFLLGVFLIK